MTFGKRLWCAGCCAMVDAVVKEAAVPVLGPLLGAAAGATHGATRRRPSGLDALLKAGLGMVAGYAVESLLVSRAQQLVCARCGCSKLAEHAA